MPPMVSTQVMTEKGVKKQYILIHTDGLLNQKNSPDQVPCDTSSLRTFCTHS